MVYVRWLSLTELSGSETYSSTLLGLLSDGTGHRLEGNRGNHACNVKDVLARVVPMVIIRLENTSRSVILRKRRRLGTNDVALALEDEDIVVFKLEVVSIWLISDQENVGYGTRS